MLEFYAAFGACRLYDIVISQSKTGKIVEGKPEYQVKVSNNCACPQSQVTVKCFGLSSVEPVDPNAIKILDEERCIVNNGKAVSKSLPVKFKYAWMNPQDFPVISAKSLCN